MGGESTQRGTGEADADASTDVPSGPLDTIERLLVEVEPAPSVLTPGTLIGEAFQVKALLGVGGMGMVYLATDLRLRRDVALKFQTVDGGVARAAREAKVLARLSHPNVITVYEVGVHADRLYIAMEYVDGQSLGTWLKTPRRWGEILDAFLRAGHGLVAAHAAGLIHRDFKPDNVLFGRDGRVRVADFGLARDIEGGDAEAGDRGGAGGHTLIGAGTPRYMSPEQARGDDLDARTDQYSFCVAAREALADRGPRWLRAMLDRGTAAEPTRRWPSMAALLGQIERRRRRTRIATGASATLAVAAIAVTGGWYAGRADVEDPCGGAEAALAPTWGPESRGALTPLLGAGAPALASLDEYARTWKVAHREACLATRVRGEQSEATLDLRMSCLDMARARLGAVVELLRTEPTSRSGAPRMVDALPSIFDCGHPDGAQALAPFSMDQRQRDRLNALVPQLAQARTLFEAGYDARALPIAAAAVVAARADDYPPLLAEALLLAGQLHISQGRPRDGLAEVTEAVHVAMAARHDRLVVDGGLMLSTYLADAMRTAEADEWLVIVEAFAQRLGLENNYRGAMLRGRAQVRRRQGRLAEAVELGRQALAFDEARGDPITTVLDRARSARRSSTWPASTTPTRCCRRSRPPTPRWSARFAAPPGCAPSRRSGPCAVTWPARSASCSRPRPSSIRPGACNPHQPSPASSTCRR
ncbi:MAG: serine/threonine protein kinase [Deltaproteobacteria bacterium]|nr:serine/threonine protein kinase [Deltaproteobacteria bacterium]